MNFSSDSTIGDQMANLGCLLVCTFGYFFRLFKLLCIQSITCIMPIIQVLMMKVIKVIKTPKKASWKLLSRIEIKNFSKTQKLFLSYGFSMLVEIFKMYSEGVYILLALVYDLPAEVTETLFDRQN